MQLPESRKATSKSALAARARMLHAKNLAWLDGFPLAVEEGQVRWLSVPPQAPPAEIHVEGRHLSQATYALNKLRVELAPALPRLAEEPDAWLASVERRLELLKGAVHRGAPLPADLFQELAVPRSLRDRASRLAADELGLRPLVHALSWVTAGDPAGARTRLDLLPGWAAGFDVVTDRLGEQPGLLLLLRLLQLAADHGPRRVEALAACLFDERAHDVPLSQGRTVSEQMLNAFAKNATTPLPEELPAGRLGKSLAAWCEELVHQNRRARQLGLRLFELATPMPALEAWASWWDTLRRLLREARALGPQPQEKIRQAVKGKVKLHQKEEPRAVSVDELLSALRWTMSEPASGRAARLLRVLELAPDGAVPPTRTELFLHWSLRGRHGTPGSLPLLAGFERYLDRFPRSAPAPLEPWAEIADWTKWQIEDEILDHELPQRTVLAVYDHLANLTAGPAQERSLDRQAAVKAVEVYLLARDSELAARLFDSLRQARRLHHYDSRTAKALALRLCRERPERFAEVLAALSDQEETAELPPKEWLEPVLDPLIAGGLGDFVLDSIVSGQLARLAACGTRSALISAAGILPLPQPSASEPPKEPDWLERYPPPLHPALRRLAAVLDDAEAQAARWLGSNFPDTAKLQREIEAIESRLGQAEDERRASLLIRLGNLRERLETPSAPGEARLGRLAARLERAWGRAVLDRWERELDALLPGALGRLLGMETDEVPACLADPRALSLLAAAARLKPAHRELALRMFRVRCGPPPWDLRDAPQNRAFVESLPHLDWSPWIDGVGTVTVTPVPDRRLHLALEDNPLEIFRMGAHFQTCLSPGSVNYFSVFTNAADINKRVLFARDDAGKVVGRFLLALTAEGRMLGFEAYCHDGSLGFEKVCNDFAAELARRMGTELVSQGRIPTLVATDWYDDGSRDLGHRFAALEEGSPLRKRLAELHPGELLGELRRALKPARLDESTLPLVLGLPELRERPELAVPLLRRVAEHPTLPDDALLTAAWLGMQAGSGSLVRRLLLKRVLEYAAPLYERRLWVDPRAVEVIQQLEPVRLLALLRRSRTVRDWMEERQGSRIELIAQVFEALYRPRQAQALWQRLATSPEVSATEEQVQRARAALQELGVTV